MSTNLPQDFYNRMQNMLGDELNDFLDSFSKPKFQALRINTLKANIDDFVNQVANEFQTDFKKQVPWERTGLYYDDTIRPGKHPYHEAGVYYIQEPSAMAPAAFLDAKPGDYVLDLCAAPGGKSTQIACQLQNKGLLVSNEIHPARAKILAENIERMGIKNAVVTNESPDNLAIKFPLCFDRIMVDAPCSGEGMFRKNEEAITQWSTENVEICADRQDSILDAADQMLRPGGKLVYSTCTFAPFENEGSIIRFLERHPQYEILSINKCGGMTDGNPDFYLKELPSADKEAYAQNSTSLEDIHKTARLFPHKLDGEGHFVALLQKKGNLSELPANRFLPLVSAYKLNDNKVTTSAGKKEDKGAKHSAKKNKFSNNRNNSGSTKQFQPIDALNALTDFLEANLTGKLSGNIVLFGEQLYLAGDDFPPTTGLKILRYGLHLGSYSKNKFEPSHALALYLKSHQVIHSCELRDISEDAMNLAKRYINGETFSFEGDNGWYLITIDGYSVGWGRLANNIMKNYYPKGLRKNLL